MPIDMGDLLRFYIAKTVEVGPDQALDECYELVQEGDYMNYHIDLLKDTFREMVRV